MKNFKITFVETRHAASLLGVFLFIAVTLTSCFNYDEPPLQEPVTVNPEYIITIAELKEMYRSQDGVLQPLRIDTDIFISGRVTSSDQQGNIFREMFIQDETGGLRIRVGRSNLYNFYRLGQRVYIKLHGLTIGNNRGTLELGVRSANPSFQTGFIEVPWMIERHVLPGRQEAPVEPRLVTVAELNNPETRRDLIGTLVKIENVVFSHTDVPSAISSFVDTLFTWAFSGSTVHDVSALSINQFFRPLMSDGMPNAGDSIVIRSSGFAHFVNEEIPRDPITAVGVFTVFDDRGQLTMRNLNDVTTLNNLSVSPANLTFFTDLTTLNFSINSNTDWTITSSESWATVNHTSGSNNREITVSIEGYPTDEPRFAYLTISSPGMFNRIVHIQQRHHEVPTLILKETFGVPVPGTGTSTGSGHPFIEEFDGWVTTGTASETAVYSREGGVDLRTTMASPAPFSGEGNVFFSNVSGEDRMFIISGINPGDKTSFEVSFASQAASTSLRVEWSTDGSTWQNIEYTKTTTVWGPVETQFEIPNPTTNLRLRFRVPAGTPGNFRIDDVMIMGW